MAIDPCDPCGCVEGIMSNDLFKQRVINLICGLQNIVSGEFQLVVERLCDPSTGDIVLVRYLYVTSTGALVAGYPKASYIDGSPYLGDIDDLVQCASSDINVASWGGTATTLGQKLMASSVPVVIASKDRKSVV